MTPSQDDLGMLLVSAVRYALGRATYIVSWTCGVVRQAWPELAGRDRFVIRRDVEQALMEATAAGRWLGMQMDHDEWRDLLRWMDEQGGAA